MLYGSRIFTVSSVELFGLSWSSTSNKYSKNSVLCLSCTFTYCEYGSGLQWVEMCYFGGLAWYFWVLLAPYLLCVCFVLIYYLFWGTMLLLHFKMQLTSNLLRADCLKCERESLTSVPVLSFKHYFKNNIPALLLGYVRQSFSLILLDFWEKSYCSFFINYFNSGYA